MFQHPLRTAVVSLFCVALAASSALAGPKDNDKPSKKSPLAGKKVLVCIGEFSEGMETYYMVYRLMEEGIIPVVAGPEVKRLQTVCHDFEPKYLGYTEKLAYFIPAEIAFKDVKPEEYDGLLLPGGRAPEEIRQNKDLIRITNHFLKNKKPVGAMCHGVQILYTGFSLKKRRMTAYHGIKADMENVGIEFVDAPVVVDGALVTSRGWPDLPYFMPKFLEVMEKRVRRQKK